MGDPTDIANMAVILASDAASYATARTCFVDGGMTDFPDLETAAEGIPMIQGLAICCDYWRGVVICLIARAAFR